MNPQAAELTCERIDQIVKNLVAAGHPPVLLVSPRIRPGLRQLTAGSLPRLKILSYNEITPDTQIESLAVVTD